MSSTTTPGPWSRLWIAVPAVSFGGIGIGLLLALFGIPFADWAGIVGCVAASCILFYQAYLKPRKDIVSLFVPLYAVLIFIVPNEIRFIAVVQVFYAVTITILAVRIEKLFNAPKVEKKTMKQILNEYIIRIEPLLSRIDEETGHLVAQALLAYRFELYQNAAGKVAETLARLEELSPRSETLERALLIFQERVGGFAVSRVTTNPEHVFMETDYDNLVIRLHPDRIENRAALDLDNALVLLYAVGIETSPDDEQALEEHQRFIIQILESYKEQLTA